MNVATNTDAAGDNSSVFHSTLPLEAKLERARMELLDLSARNRLLNMPRTGRTIRTIEVVDERSPEVFRLLVRENRPFTFLPGRASKAAGADASPESDPEEIHDLAQPEDDTVDSRGVLSRHSDTKLQTRLTSAALQKRLLDLYSDARTLEEEQGVNILFLTLGSLKWIDPANKDNARYAPLVLVPVNLERGSAAQRFKLKWRQEEIASNLSLEAYLDRIHSLKLPSFEGGEDFDLAAYVNEVADVISSKPGWEVIPDDIVLGFFSFAKFLMYRDLDPEVWPAEGRLTDLPLIRSLLTEGFPQRDGMISDDAPIDPLIAPAEMQHIVDADSSQTLAIHDVRCGHNLVIQGPPGTGKSQTIANIIASAVANGKTVLFVAEKMAALEVVKRRLDQAGVGDTCIELHSNKANKRLLLEELKRTWELGSPRGDFPDALNSKLLDARDALNDHAQRMHCAHVPSSLSPYQVIGELVRLRNEGHSSNDLELERPQEWTLDGRAERENLLYELNQRLVEIGRPAEHPWWCVGLESILPTQLDRFIRRIANLKSRLATIGSKQDDLARTLEMPQVHHLREFDAVAVRARRIASAPDGFGETLALEEWDHRNSAIESLLAAGCEYASLYTSLTDKVKDAGWTLDVGEARRTLETLPSSFGADAFERVQRLHILLPQLTDAAGQLKTLLGISEDSATFGAIQRTMEFGGHVATAPAASPETFMAAVWDHGIEQAADLVVALDALEEARSRIGNRFSDAAWGSDCTAARQAFASQGSSFLRFLNGEWRRANRLIKSFLNQPERSTEEVIRLLDVLIKGQRALAAIRTGDALGRSAFGAQWRGERSRSAELRTFLQWIRGLGPFAKEIRSVASQGRSQSAIGASAHCLETIWQECDALLDAVGPDLGIKTGDQISVILARCAEVNRANAVCKETLTELSPSIADRLSLLERLIASQDAARAIASASELGKTCFGAAWMGTKSSWPVLVSAAQWVNANGDIRKLAAHLQDRGKLAERADSVESLLAEFARDAETLFTDLRLDRMKLFGVQEVCSLSTDRLSIQFDVWLSNPEQLSKWVAYRERADRARAVGLGALIDALENGRLTPDQSVATFRRAYYEAILEDQVRHVPEIGRFDGHIHGRLAREFAELDQQRIRAARLEVVRAHHRHIPQAGGGIGPLGVLRAEIAKRKGHMPIRQLMSKAASAIQALKPVVMMSPLSVAQFLPPGQLRFDLLVMDEASQIQPVDALGAIARCRQVVVVGDERQLPPTKFFAKMSGGQAEEEDGENAQVADIESILGLFIARGMPQRMLRWHYRSRHQSLIAVSNTQFYENKLFIVPSPYTSEAGRGLRFHHIRDGRFDSGNSRTNVVEARAIAEAVIRHAKERPELSLGVASFSANQRRAIRDQIELLRRANPDSEPFFHAHTGEPFFIKNLENVQGDERDVIFISVGYAPNPQGHMAMVFGPLSSEGGERRLNVLISRAKLLCEVFSSITDEDIDTDRAKGKGVFAFKLFLHFARTGRLSMARTSGKDHESVFEIQVATALQERGYQVHAQVGIAGFFIDLAVADSKQPGRYILGIECDGIAYHSGRSARDRDRLRQSVLEDHGWIIYRIWSADWFQRPTEQLTLVIAAIEAAKGELDSRSDRQPQSGGAVGVQIVTVERVETTEVGLVEIQETRSSGVVYVEADPVQPQGWPELHETPANVLAQLVEEIVKIEGPVHVDEVTARIRGAWNLHRSGGRIQSSVERAVAHAVRNGRVEVRNQFLSMPGATIRVRDRSGVNSLSLRKPEMLPPQEISEGVLQVVRSSLGGGQDEIAQAVSHLLGFKATSAQLREAVQSAITALVADRTLTQRGSYLVLANAESEETSKA